jgi:hypothetical protein
MTHFIRTKTNKTIFSVDVYTEQYDLDSKFGGKKYIELSSDIDIGVYSKYLLSNLSNSGMIIPLFDEISEIRGWLWESYFMTKRNIYSKEEMSNVHTEITNICETLCEKLDLYYVTD